MNRRGQWVYWALSAAWVVVLVWQFMEHRRVSEAARQTLISRARDITYTLGIVIRSQRRWGGMVSKERLENALAELIKPGELNSIALRNTEGEIVAAVGSPLAASQASHTPSGVSWTEDSLILANLVDLGSVSPESEPNRPTIIVPRASFPAPPGSPGTNSPTTRPGRPPGQQRPEAPAGDAPSPPPSPVPQPGPSLTISTNDTGSAPPPANNQGRGRGRPPGRPFWMSEQEYKDLILKKGLHSFIIVMSADTLHSAIRGDVWIRFVIGLLATAAGAGAGLAWRNVQRSADLELRLVKASEMNSHLKQMNLAAAGLAHETRNPLNIIRGLAQLISRETRAPAEILERSSAIVEEADRVTAQLNEFINYSRPREVRPAQVRFAGVAAEVARALAFDAEEKGVELVIPEDELLIEADEQLLRQTLFNLILNAIQAVGENGRIEVSAQRKNGTAAIEVRDNGPGIPPERRVDIFRPYFTTHQKGTGLGLAVVQQIVAAHGWEIECLDNQPAGALFRIGRVKVLSRA